MAISTTTVAVAKNTRAVIFSSLIIWLAAGLWVSAHAFFVPQKHAELDKGLSKAYKQTSGARQTPKAFQSFVKNKPLWVTMHGLNTDAKAALSLMEKAYEHGIDPGKYHTDAIREQAVSAYGNNEALVALERRITDTVIQYVLDLQNGVTPSKRYDKIGIIKPIWTKEVTERTLRTQRNVYRWLEAMAPSSTHYKVLQEALKKYSVIEKTQQWPEIKVGNVIKPGESDNRIIDIARLLELTGDLEGSFEGVEYTPELQEAVIRFQNRHGLEADGVIGTQTQRALAAPVNDRIDQIRLTMERIRQLPDSLGKKFILVNIPAFKLAAYDNGEKTLDMDVIVGKTARKTPIFSNYLGATIFNPRWNVPSKIAKRDLLPKVQKNSEYLKKARFTVLQDGEKVDPSTIDWHAVTAQNFPYQLKQASGRSNALGKVKFTIPNNQAIYLHDTSDRKLFAKSYRALSSGCIRVSDPLGLANYVLASRNGWTHEKVEKHFNSSRRVQVESPAIPVHTIYWTAWAETDGTLHFRNDIYKKDKRILTALGPYEPTQELQVASR
ncbi:MAG: L,D-transpeptidase family protein [Rickettsiales bacterium]|nr:L,D-transpeptidase family protein [Rickettsiales bacterium]